MGKKTKSVKVGDQNKAWHQRSTPARPQRERSIKNTFLIYCEGTKTEPAYFKSFPVTTETEIEAIGLGRSRTALVEKVLELTAPLEIDPETQIWVVFDRDVNYTNLEEGHQDFNDAIKLAKKHKMRCAYSNDCFELWFVLHDEYLEAALHRKQLYKKLSERLNCNYEKEGKQEIFAKSLYGIFQQYLPTALRNAQRLHQSHEDKEYCHQNPCTTVYELVTELNKNLRQ